MKINDIDIKTWCSPVFGDSLFNKVGKGRHRELMRILNISNPTTKELFFLCYSLSAANIPFSDALHIINIHNTWDVMPSGKGYDIEITEDILRRVYKYGSKGTCPLIHVKRTSAPLPVTFLASDIFKIFLEYFKPRLIKRPVDIPGLAAVEYVSHGIAALPRNPRPLFGCGKKCHETGYCKHPVGSWHEYKNKLPTWDDVRKWDYSAGVCLVASHTVGFLDIDVKSEFHQKGIENFDISLFRGYSYERSKSGGYHIFGFGEYAAKPVISAVDYDVKLIGFGGLIVSYPSPGYVFGGVI